MSKSGLFAHFGSKEELQLATIEAARRRFVDHVIRPSRPLPRGRARLEAMLADWLAYFRSETFPGGCFFHNVKAEFDSRPDTAVRAVMAEDVRDFLGFLEREVRKTQEAGELDPALDPQQLAFELDALGSAANSQFQILEDPRSSTARLGMRRPDATRSARPSARYRHVRRRYAHARSVAPRAGAYCALRPRSGRRAVAASRARRRSGPRPRRSGSRPEPRSLEASS